MIASTDVRSSIDPCGPVVGTVTIAPAIPAPEDTLTARNRATWTAGDFDKIAVGFAPGAAAFVKRVGVATGDTVLDVATGTGNLAIPAAKLGGTVTGVDIAPNLIATARAKSAARRLNIEFHEGNAEALPYADGTFTTVMSMFGVMFAPRQTRAIAELLRVTRPGGRIALANWMPNGFIGRMLRAHTSRVPPPAGVPSPLAWGDEAQLRALLEPHGDRIESVTFTPRTIALAYLVPPRDVVALFRDYYGPSVRTFAALDESGREALTAELEAMWTDRNIAPPGATAVEAEFLDVRITLKA